MSNDYGCGFELPFTAGFCRNRPQGTFRLSRANGEVICETPRCADCGEKEVLFHSNDVFQTAERATFEAFDDDRAPHQDRAGPGAGVPGDPPGEPPPDTPGAGP